MSASTRVRVCGATCAWGAWSACGEGECAPGTPDVAVCGPDACGYTERECTEACDWGPWGACVSLTCPDGGVADAGADAAPADGGVESESESESEAE